MEVDEASMLALTKLFLKSIVSEFISTKPPHIFVLAFAQTVNCSYALHSYVHGDCLIISHESISLLHNSIQK